MDGFQAGVCNAKNGASELEMNSNKALTLANPSPIDTIKQRRLIKFLKSNELRFQFHARYRILSVQIARTFLLA
jgi:hypothetical protein